MKVLQPFKITTLLAFTFTVLCSAALISAAIEWKVIVHDFGNIAHEKKVSYEFEFKNPGMFPLIIENVESSCGCTVPTYPKEPVAPGKSGKIKVEYDAESTGYFSKEIKVYTNTKEKLTTLQIKGIVINQ